AYTKSQSDEVIAFDSITEMLMALEAGKIHIMELPEPVGKYLLRQTSSTNKYITCHYIKGVDYYLSIGFKDGSKWFEPFNAAIKAMNEDDTLLLLKAKYIDYAKDDMKPITFENFPDAETVKIAVTGDQPPIDYIAADGTPAGFNTALLAEIGRRLKVNIELLNVNAGARAAALSSGRADGVFWFWYDKQTKTPRDVPAGVSLTEPYYTYDTFMYIGKKLHK
ncbi:MAG: transporter substrate-binding domain-containing protein, partial [Synergistaceae bacterium]|nr:transporter substrate-binding domain-containing protein [Synergistaceae bacterium]